MGATEDAAARDRLRDLAQSELGGDQLRAEVVQLAQDLTTAHAPSSGSSPLAALPTLGELSGGIDWFTKQPPPVPMLFTKRGRDRTIGAVPRGQVMILAAAGGAGKTFAALGACLAVATGDRWLGHFGVTEPGSAVGLFGETTLEVLWSRVHAIAKAMEASGKPLDRERARQRLRLLPLLGKATRLLDANGRGGAERTAHFDALLTKLQKVEDLRLVVVDTLARFGAPDCEVSQTLATETVTALETIAALPSRPVVLALHHTSQQARTSGKDANATGVRGVTAIADNARVVWMMETAGTGELDDFVWLKARKGNDIEASQDQWLLVRKEGGALHALNDADQARYDALRSETESSLPARRSTPPSQGAHRLSEDDK
jgi:RecA-family ATPase